MTKEILERALLELEKIDVNRGREFGEALGIIRGLLDNDKFRIVVLGEFSTGKSTFLNALLGRKILYSCNIESTGAVTVIENGASKEAYVYNEANDLVEKLSLERGKDIEKLNDYLNIRNETGQRADKVHIYYPLEQVPKDIFLIDTPGLQGISKEQLLVTKDQVKRANAILFLVKIGDLEGTELQLISGKNPDLGELNTKNLFVLANKISEIHENKNCNNPIEKIEERRKAISQKLAAAGLSEVPVFALDSRDCLWSRDEQLYEELVRLGKKEGAEVLSREAYRKRSAFEAFENELFRFFREDRRQQCFLKDIAEKLMVVTEALVCKIKAEGESGLEDQDIQLKRLNENVQLACESRRRYYVRIMQSVSRHLDRFSSLVEADLKEQKQERRLIAEKIDSTITGKEKLTDGNVKKCLEYTAKIMRNKTDQIQREVNKQKELLLKKYLREIFDETFAKLFKEQMKIEVEGSFNDLAIVLKADASGFDLDEKPIREYREKLQAAKDQLAEYELEEASYVKRGVEEKERELTQRENMAEESWDRLISRLGDRPLPEQKYRLHTWTTGILFWKKYHSELVPDGLDDTVCIRWDEKYQAGLDRYEETLKQIGKERDENDRMLQRLRCVRRKLEDSRRRAGLYEKGLREMEQGLQELSRKNEKMFVSQKKGDILSCCYEMMGRMEQEILNSSAQYLSELKERIRNCSKDYVDRYMESYRQEQIKKSKKLAAEIQMVKKSSGELLEKLYDIRGMLTDEL